VPKGYLIVSAALLAQAQVRALQRVAAQVKYVVSELLRCCCGHCKADSGQDAGTILLSPRSTRTRSSTSIRRWVPDVMTSRAKSKPTGLAAMVGQLCCIILSDLEMY
jgi:hypothetical protein